MKILRSNAFYSAASSGILPIECPASPPRPPYLNIFRFLHVWLLGQRAFKKCILKRGGGEPRSHDFLFEFWIKQHQRC